MNETMQMAAKYSMVGVFTRMAIRDENKASAEERALARAQAEGTQAYQIAEGRWVATSTSQPGTVYEVNVNGTVRCSCEGAQHGLTCRHAAVVRAKIAEDASVKAMVDEMWPA